METNPNNSRTIEGFKNMAAEKKKKGKMQSLLHVPRP